MAKRYYNSSNRMMERDVPATIKNDPSKFANLPTEPMMVLYPECDYMNTRPGDSLIEIDAQIDGDVRGAKKQLSRKKY